MPFSTRFAKFTPNMQTHDLNKIYRLSYYIKYQLVKFTDIRQYFLH
ncbi:hypothetical protein ALTERO38_20429 [Alteromonas sp. 38]|nr:hypothetical protein ALTER154_100105 [Alteromonas sp. 154]VXB09845.1 hypothetical protein ALTERO38_20429 [Alteromonas sp. 38]